MSGGVSSNGRPPPRTARNSAEGIRLYGRKRRLAKPQIAKYPDGRQASAVILLLWRAQEQAGGWLPQKAIEYVAEMLGMARIRVLEVATFYTMFNLEPVGKFNVQLCTTTPCMLRGSDALKAVCQRRIGD